MWSWLFVAVRLVTFLKKFWWKIVTLEQKNKFYSCGHLWLPPSAWWSFLCSFSIGSGLSGLHGHVSEAGLEWGSPSWEAIFLGPAACSGPMGPRHDAASTRHRRTLPAFNHRWHAWSGFPGPFSCLSSWAWSKQHRKNNTSHCPAQGICPLQTLHDYKFFVKVKVTLLSSWKQWWTWGNIRRESSTFLRFNNNNYNNNLPITKSQSESQIKATLSELLFYLSYLPGHLSICREATSHQSLVSIARKLGFKDLSFTSMWIGDSKKKKNHVLLSKCAHFCVSICVQPFSRSHNPF